MKKIYSFVALLCLSQFCLAQLTVTGFANNSTICLGSSTNITASATPVTYNVTAIPNALIADYGVNILADPAGITGVTPMTRSAGVNNDDCRWDGINIPFTFRFFGNPYTSIKVSSNGWITFGSTSITTGYGSIPSASEANNAVHGITGNLTFVSSGILEYFTYGTAPNRIFVVSYQNAPFASGGGTATFQIHLKETSNIVEIHTTSCTNTTLSKTQGIENATGTVATVVAGRNNTTNWTSTGFTNGYRFTPDAINFSWSPSGSLSSPTGAAVIATPTATTTYTINATNASSGATGSTTVTVNIDPASNTLAATAGGAAVCQNISVSAGGTNYRSGTCNLIAGVIPAGASPVTNSINTCTQVDLTSTKRGTADLYAARKYDIEPILNPTTSTANIKLYYLQSEFDDFNTRAADSGHKPLPTGPADATGISNVLLRQFHGTGTNPTNYTGAAVDFTTATSGFTVVWDATKNWWEVTVPVNGFSGFYLSSSKVGTLNIGLNYFKGVQLDKKNILSWKVSATSTQAKFELQRSADGNSYTTIHSLTATKEQCDNPFEFTDNNPLAGKNYYRLKFIDVDGKATLSNTVLLTQKTSKYSLIGINPNIVVSNQNPTLKINASEKGTVTIVLTDFSGRVLQKQAAQLQIGLNQIVINTNGIATGAYNVTTYSNSDKPQTLKLIKQ
ncbi:MAG: hypothetical protein IPP48_08275 [Chitinophagaceae bacterium]|nr:hypothetical protein [Chitinophagaceae bacterium]